MTTPAPLTERETLERYEKRGALLRGHFRLTSGLHSDVYLQSALVLQHPEEAGILGEGLAAAFREEHPQTVLAPAESSSHTRSPARWASARSSPSARTA